MNEKYLSMPEENAKFYTDLAISIAEEFALSITPGLYDLPDADEQIEKERIRANIAVKHIITITSTLQLKVELFEKQIEMITGTLEKAQSDKEACQKEYIAMQSEKDKLERTLETIKNTLQDQYKKLVDMTNDRDYYQSLYLSSGSSMM